MAQKNLLEIDRADLIDSLVINHILKKKKERKTVHKENNQQIQMKQSR